MGDLSEHFSRAEFACKCGCGGDTIDAETLALAEQVRSHEGQPVTVNSAYRCVDHNAAVGGSRASQHLLGRAVDLAVSDPAETAAWLGKKYPDRLGVGVYRTFVHVDTRADKARWGG